MPNQRCSQQCPYPHKVSDRRSPEVMRNLPDNPSLSTRPNPWTAKVFNLLPIAVKYKRTFRKTLNMLSPLLVEDISKHLGKMNDPSILILRGSTIQSYCALL
jgi:hypothetical protein